MVESKYLRYVVTPYVQLTYMGFLIQYAYFTHKILVSTLLRR